MGRISIAAYRPKPGKEAELTALTGEHHGILLAEGLVTERKPIVMRSSDGTIVEVFEWKSDEAVAGAHANAAVQKLWERYEKCSEYVSLPNLPESKELFATFDAVDFK